MDFLGARDSAHVWKKEREGEKEKDFEFLGKRWDHIFEEQWEGKESGRYSGKKGFGEKKEAGQSRVRDLRRYTRRDFLAGR